MTGYELAELQRGLRDVIAGRPYDGELPYLRQLAGSRQIRLIREISLWWRTEALWTACPLTTALLDQRKLLEAEARRLLAAPSMDPNRRSTGRAFLELQAASPDPLVKALARFERSLHAVSLDGDGQTYHVDWSCDPIAVLSSILERRLVTEVPGRYRTEISAAVPGGWRVIPIDQHDPSRDNV